MKVALTKEFNGKKEIELDLESLTGKDLLLAEKQARMKGGTVSYYFLVHAVPDGAGRQAGRGEREGTGGTACGGLPQYRHAGGQFFIQSGLREGKQIRTLAISMAQASFTSIEFFLGLIPGEMMEYAEIMAEKQQKS